MKNIFTLFTVLFFVFSAKAQGLWEQRATCPASSKGSVSFSINSLGYVYTGEATSNFYKYDPAANSWILKADYPGGLRYGAAGFATDSFGFIGGGKNSSGQFFNDFYRYDPVADSWMAKANYPDSVERAFAFCINNTGYIAGGNADLGVSKMCYSYNPTTDAWAMKDSLPIRMHSGFSCAVNGKGYCGLGVGLSGTAHLDSVYEYNAVADSWVAKAGYHLANANFYASVYSFVINNLLYVSDHRATTGTHGAVGIFDPAINSWSVINTFPFPAGGGCDPLTSYVGLTIGNRSFLGGWNGCTNTTFWEYDPANSFAISAITPDTVCEHDLIQVSFSSSLTFNAGNHFKLKFNGTNYSANNALSDSVAGTSAGTYTFKVPSLFYSGSNTLAELAVYSTGPANQTSYLSTKVLVKRAPVVELPLAADYWHCQGSALLIYRGNAAGETHYWSSNPWGILDTANVLSITPTSTTTIYVTDVYNATGCSASDSTVVHYSTLPSLQITDSVFSICAGSGVVIGGTTVANGSYAWTGSGFSSSAVNPAVNPATNSTYHLLLTDTATTCRASGNTQVNLAQAPAQTICFVTVDSASTHNVIVWEKVNREASDSFYIYREISTNNYQKIGAVHGDSLSEFHDYAANPNITAYRYKISTRDTCTNEGALSPYHNTIHLQYLGSGNLIWNVYQIENDTTPVSSFDVLRDSLGNGSWQVMLNVPGNQYTATDINFSQHPNALYRIAANWSYTCTAARSGGTQVLSNILSITGTGIAGLAAENEIQLYPNPAADKLFIQTNGAEIEQINIYNTTGSLVMGAGFILNNQVSIINLANGVYIAQIKTKDGIVMKRWVKM